jgi:ankyrin repeat protein
MQDGWTALMLAAWGNDVDLVTKLVDAGASTLLRTKVSTGLI